ncbi:MAG TPA: alpha-L-arabinofuranosidase C-terminal domain-containing protein [Tepidisphaeraceae bacterium]|nr:alpha-L-arabinofuranosidase C-terminal domain-containing protein [Tepidisphaeraceae bacterium]
MPAATITVLPDEPIGVIRPELHGQFAEHLGACVYGGLWVGEESPIANYQGYRRDVLAALQRLRVPVLRWPGGCFADDYHWEDGVGPRDARPRRVNGWWGHDVETNAFGTHEFLNLCKLLGAQPYLAGNVGSGTPRELRHWIEYCNWPGGTTLSDRRKANGQAEPWNVKYWGVGNENWGCGGNMDPEDYAAEFKRFAAFLFTFMRAPTHMPLFLVACGPNRNDPEWTRRFFAKLQSNFGFSDYRVHGFGAHYYAGTAGPSATEYDVDQWYQLLHQALGVEQLILDQRAAMDQFDVGRKVGLMVDEWGTWHAHTPGTPVNHLWQQNTIRDALVAALTLDAFHRHADRLVMCNVAQVANVLQAMVLTRAERMVLTPTYHVFDAYKGHQRGTAVRCEFAAAKVRFAAGGERRELPGLTGSASVAAGNVLTLSVVNPHATFATEATIDLRGRRPKGPVRAVTIAADDLHAHNTFDALDAVRPAIASVEADGHEWTRAFLPASVTVLTVPLG